MYLSIYVNLLFQVYPKRDITNIVEASHYQKVSNWCKVGHKKCKGSHSEWVKPYRCLGELNFCSTLFLQLFSVCLFSFKQRLLCDAEAQSLLLYEDSVIQFRTGQKVSSLPPFCH